jgi:hypothetical protein
VRASLRARRPWRACGPLDGNHEEIRLPRVAAIKTGARRLDGLTVPRAPDDRSVGALERPEGIGEGRQQVEADVEFVS